MFLNEQHEMVRKLAREFAVNELKPEILDQVEETGVFPQDIIDKMGEAGFFGVKIPKKYGGAGADTRSYVVMIEEIARVSAVASLYANSPNSLGGGPILLSGTEEQIHKYLTPLSKVRRYGLRIDRAGCGIRRGWYEHDSGQGWRLLCTQRTKDIHHHGTDL